MNIKVKKLRSDAMIPVHGSPGSAGYDLYACSTINDRTVFLVKPHCTVMIPTGLAFEIPDGYFAGLFARSGLASKHGLRPANCVSVCDSDYRGEYLVPIHNDTDQVQLIESGERIAQMIVLPCQSLTFLEEDELSKTERGDGGFGSTGKN